MSFDSPDVRNTKVGISKTNRPNAQLQSINVTVQVGFSTDSPGNDKPGARAVPELYFVRRSSLWDWKTVPEQNLNPVE